jgi:hypothetical protein
MDLTRTTRSDIGSVGRSSSSTTASCNSSIAGFFTPYHDFSLPVAWWADPRVAEVRREIAGFLERRMGNAYFGFKDPRTVRLMPMWHQIINELRLTPKIVFCLRKPAQVATLAQCS